jgi:hypothetical protein
MFRLERQGSGGLGFRAGGIGQRRIRVERLTQVLVEEHALGVEGGPDTPEIAPARVERGKMLCDLCSSCPNAAVPSSAGRPLRLNPLSLCRIQPRKADGQMTMRLNLAK